MQATVEELQHKFNTIPVERYAVLNELTNFIKSKSRSGQKVVLNFICTHNSRRSHLAQLWAQTAAYVYGVSNVVCFSGGTEATAFNPRAVKAMAGAGFNIVTTKAGDNPVYEVRFSDDAPAVIAFSKTYDDPFNQSADFAAVMTCSHADENCPLVQGATARIALTYDDPKEFDGTPLEAAKYTERVKQIGTEILFAFSKVNS
ncbi:MAG: protein-tyrosine-phosphatase [Bacteroidetes bacterium]|nr:protein-tyrosine-phosphatase [Bacteroidota bacterium]